MKMKSKKTCILACIGIVIMLCLPILVSELNNNFYAHDSSNKDFRFITIIIFILNVITAPIIVFVVIAILLVIISTCIDKEKYAFLSSLVTAYRGIKTNTSKVSIEEFLTRTIVADPNFSIEKFNASAEAVFLKLQSAFTQRDCKIARAFEKEELFNKHKAEIDEYISTNKINILEDISVLSVKTVGSDIYSYTETLTVELEVKMKDYIVDATSKAVLEGDSINYKTAIYNLIFERIIGVKTTNFSNINTTNCPNCFGELNVDLSGKCDKCGEIITTGKYDWILSNITKLNKGEKI